MTPVAIMSSEAKGNHRRITQLMESLHWFGRGAGSFRIFKCVRSLPARRSRSPRRRALLHLACRQRSCTLVAALRACVRVRRQPLVPVVSVADGQWLLDGVMQPMAKPGGHGAIWKLMWDEGVFDWLCSKVRGGWEDGVGPRDG